MCVHTSGGIFFLVTWLSSQTVGCLDITFLLTATSDLSEGLIHWGRHCLNCNELTYILELCISAEQLVIVHEDFSEFPESPMAQIVLVLWLGYEHFVTCVFQFIFGVLEFLWQLHKRSPRKRYTFEEWKEWGLGTRNFSFLIAWHQWYYYLSLISFD
jgi:hypothetical protein